MTAAEAPDGLVVTERVPPVRPSSDPGGMVEVKYIVLQFYLVTFFAGLIGNTLVLYVITKYDEIRTRSVSNYYIWNLALADELFVLSLPFFCYATWTGDWIFGNWTCKLMYVFRDCNKFASVLTLCALSVDRYLASFHHLTRYRQIRVGIVVCLAIWAVCLAASAPYWMYATTVPILPPRSNLSAGRFGSSFNSSANCLPTENEIGNRTELISAAFSALSVSSDDSLGHSTGNRNDTIATGSGIICQSGPPRNVAPSTARKLSCRHGMSNDFWEWWTLAQLVFGVLLPLVAIGIFNGLLLRRLKVLNAVRASFSLASTSSALSGAISAARKNRSALPKNEGGGGGNNVSTLAADSGARGTSFAAAASSGGKNGAMGSRVRRLTSVSRMMLAVVTMFAVCQLPYHVIEILSIRVRGSGRMPSASVTRVFIYCNAAAQILVFLSSCINPIVYGIFNKNYRLLYRQTICGICEPCRSARRRSDVISACTQMRTTPATTVTSAAVMSPSPSITCCCRQQYVSNVEERRCSNLQDGDSGTKRTLLNRFDLVKTNRKKSRLHQGRSCCCGPFMPAESSVGAGVAADCDDVIHRVWPGNSIETGQRIAVDGEVVEIAQETPVTSSLSPTSTAAASHSVVSSGHKRSTGLSLENRRSLSNCSF